jgi:hypothetical protein
VLRLRRCYHSRTRTICYYEYFPVRKVRTIEFNMVRGALVGFPKTDMLRRKQSYYETVARIPM